MKKIIVFISLLFTTIQADAEGRNIPLCINCLGDYHDSPPIRHAPPNIRLPVVEIDGIIIYIHSLQFGSNITVTLEDIDGNIIYNVITITEVN